MGIGVQIGGGGWGGGSFNIVGGGMTGDTTAPGGGAQNPVVSSMAAAPVLTAVQVITGAVGAYEAYKASEDIKDVTEANVKAVQAETAEKMRVMEEENRRAEAAVRARAFASGLSGASSELYLNSFIESGRQDIDWLRQVGESNVNVTKAEGRAAYHQARASMWGQVGSTIGSAVSTYSMLT